MTKPRSSIISLQDTPYYHCISRCVRRAFLCGDDNYSGKNFDHRKPWLTDRIFFLSSIFSIDIAAYAIMSNHYHLVLHVDTERINQWSEADVIKRWLRLYKGPKIVQDYLEGNLEHQAHKDLVSRLVNTWRARLKDISWFMRCLNEYIARKANNEDNCTGRFWEGRFKSQALLDEAALLSGMVYVDLNPVRAGISPNLEKSDFTSVQQRILLLADRKKPRHKKLMPFSTQQSTNQEQRLLPYRLDDYLELVDWTGRAIRNDKRGFIPDTEPRLISTLGIDPEQWKYLTETVQERTMTSLHGMESLAQINKKREVA